MSSRSRPAPKPKTGRTASGNYGAIKQVAKAGANILGIGGKNKDGTKRRRKKSALFYAREIQRLKLKKKYEKVKLGLSR